MDENMMDKIKRCCLDRRIHWSTHTAVRIQERGISRKDVINCLESGEIIEEYPTDFPHPSCLIFGYAVNQNIIHVVAGCDEEFVYFITAYFPNTKKFEDDLKTRKER